MRSKRRNTNIKLLEMTMRNVGLSEDKIVQDGAHNGSVDKVDSSAVKEVKPVEKLKGKGVKKDALINTKKLLTI